MAQHGFRQQIGGEEMGELQVLGYVLLSFSFIFNFHKWLREIRQDCRHPSERTKLECAHSEQSHSGSIVDNSYLIAFSLREH
jgi:hypothetical protein